jgi:hypothetical protein
VHERHQLPFAPQHVQRIVGDRRRQLRNRLRESPQRR